MLVVDANIALFWTIETPASPAAKAVLRSGRSLIAPDLVIAEVTNALFIQVKRGLLDKERVADGLNLLPRWFSELCPASVLRNRAFELANQLNHPAYDCFYLALALLRESTFVTSDRHFHRKAVAAGYQKSVS
jgi:predicted nucleic acid-binding protein